MGPEVSEKRNLIRFLLLHPLQLLRFIARTPLRLGMYLRRRRKMLHKPMKAANRIHVAAPADCELHIDRFVFSGEIADDDPKEFAEIELASCTIPANDHLDWACNYADHEDTFALNRFGWLFSTIHAHASKEMARRALAWIDQWIDCMGANFEHPAWESYSVSERLANWPFILSMVEQLHPIEQTQRKKIAANLWTHLEYLLQYMEMRDEFTNNHILNNARGLFIGGLILDHKHAVAQAQKTFLEWTPKLFYNDGMLQEGSSHYQFLLAQRFEQVGLLTHLVEDDDFQAFIEKWTEAIRRAGEFFRIAGPEGSSTMPLMGDISPDFAPAWFSAPGANGWEAIKKRYRRRDINNCSDSLKYKGLIRQGPDFLRYDQDDITVFWHVPEGPVPVGSHAHFDVGGFILFVKGREIFTDAGRRSYQREGSAGQSAGAHNCPLIDGLGPFCEDHHLNLLDACPHQEARTRITTDSAGRPIISLAVDGFRRLPRPVRWERTFSFQERGLTIDDTFTAKGNHKIFTRFVLASGLTIDTIEAGFRITAPGVKATLQALDWRGEEEHPLFTEQAEISRCYGNSETTLAILAGNTINGNHSNTYDIKW